MSGVTKMLTVPSGAPVNSMNGVYVDWMFSDDLPVTFLPPAICLRSATMQHAMRSIEHSCTAMSQFSTHNRITFIAAFP